MSATTTVGVRYMIDDVPAAIAFYTTHLGFTVEQDAAPAFAAVSRDGVRLLVGIDVGTTLCKAAVVRAADGTEVAHGATRTPWTVVPTGAELAPELLLEAAVAATAAALEHIPDGPVAGVGVTSMAETGVLLDRHGRPLAPAPVHPRQPPAAVKADGAPARPSRKVSLFPTIVI